MRLPETPVKGLALVSQCGTGLKKGLTNGLIAQSNVTGDAACGGMAARAYGPCVAWDGRVR